MNPSRISGTVVPLLFFLLFCLDFSVAQPPDDPSTRRIALPNGWHLSPAGSSLDVGDFPMNIEMSPDGHLAAVLNCGQSDQSIQLIDVRAHRVVDSVPIPMAWLGLRFSRDGRRLYASGGNLNQILIYDIRDSKLHCADSIVLGRPWPEKISPTGIALDESRERIYIATKESNALYIASLGSKKVVAKIPLSSEAYACCLSPDKSTLYVSLWGGKGVVVFNTESDTVSGVIPAGNHPNDICLTPDGKYLFTANSQDNTVSVIDTRRRVAVETLDAAVYPNSPEGSTTNSVALSGDGKTLFIANADNNCLAVFDVSEPGHSRSRGFIPTGWYPTCVRVSGDELWVANGKGFTSHPDPHGPNPAGRVGKAEEAVVREEYIGSLFRGTVSIVPIPDDGHLGAYSTAVYRNTPFSHDREAQTGGEPGNPVPVRQGDPSPVKYVFYVMKENRTYDQVLGDDPRGNGDTSLVLFPRKITPNEHAIAREFVLLDNFYVDAEVSADGHNWSMAAYANDYIEKTWPTRYGGRGGNYDYIGNRDIALPKNGFLWDDCLRNGVSFRNYGEFCDDGVPMLSALAAHTCRAYPGWDLGIHDTTRERIWEHEFDSLLAAGTLPRLSIVYLPNDHTSGLSRGAYTPFAAVADNDLALGKLIEHLSGSSIWKECAVFVLEDDAQDGPDHVDAHRSTAYVAGGLVRRHAVDHTMYSSASMLRTMELILGLTPMSQYDAAAEPMWRCFTPGADLTPFHAVPAEVNLDEKNTAWNNGGKEEEINLTDADRVPDGEFNLILWGAIKGGVPMPPVHRSAFLSTEKDDD
jgi:YVTN family beta-propeller protein